MHHSKQHTAYQPETLVKDHVADLSEMWLKKN